MLFLALKGFIIGLLIAMPVGPIAMLVVRRTLSRGVVIGMATGLGGATADAVYGAVAGFGFAAVSSFLIGEATALRLAGGGVLLLIGVLGLRAHASDAARARDRPGRLGFAAAYLSTLLLTLANPMTIVSFLAAVATLGVGDSAGSYDLAGIFVGAVFVGSAAWQLALAIVAALVRRRFTPRALHWADRTSAFMLIGFGLAAWISILG